MSKKIPAELQDLTQRGQDSILDAVGMEAHGSGGAQMMQQPTGLLPDAAARKAMETIAGDPTSVLLASIAAVRRGGTSSLSGVYSGQATPMPFTEDPADPLGLDDLVTHTVPLSRGPELYATFQKKEDECIEVVLQP